MSFLIKKLLTALVIAFAVIALYYFTMGNGAVTDTASEVSGEQLAQKSAAVLADTKKIKTLKLDTSIFEDPVFTSLKDTRVQIEDVDTGRSNPFAPIE